MTERLLMILVHVCPIYITSMLIYHIFARYMARSAVSSSVLLVVLVLNYLKLLSSLQLRCSL